MQEMALGRDRRAQASEDRALSHAGVPGKPCRTRGPGLPRGVSKANPAPRAPATWWSCLPQACSLRRGWHAASLWGAQAQRGDHQRLSWGSGAPSSAWSLPTCPLSPPAGVRGLGASGLSLPSLHTVALGSSKAGGLGLCVLPGLARSRPGPPPSLLWLWAASLQRGPWGCPSTDSNIPSPTGRGPPGPGALTGRPDHLLCPRVQVPPDWGVRCSPPPLLWVPGVGQREGWGGMEKVSLRGPSASHQACTPSTALLRSFPEGALDLYPVTGIADVWGEGAAHPTAPSLPSWRGKALLQEPESLTVSSTAGPRHCYPSIYDAPIPRGERGHPMNCPLDTTSHHGGCNPLTPTRLEPWGPSALCVGPRAAPREVPAPAGTS
ncbi:uncharacterized protein LOC112676069 [Canis lupus dingo]|uniref:uncharacterized protein LOC112676069 n=1 Tax=Canis lupus dingo TaxID=286419 RepID=UPI0020C5074B|nr:uncharacterized protein LOC112676069 [Canis lupus dingo]